MPGSKLSDYVVSSYTPTLSNMLYSQAPRSPSLDLHKSQVLAVALPLESQLPAAHQEVDIVEKHALKLHFTRLMETDATVDNVVKGMFSANFVHFACHGQQSLVDSTQSALLLAGNSHLTLAKISQLQLPSAELAFLSACQTATGDEKLSQEAVHLAAGMLLAGYRGVVATMWSIQDSDAPIVADAFYAELFKDSQPDASRAARALHKAVKKLIDKNGERSYLSWVPFIHMGK